MNLRRIDPRRCPVLPKYRAYDGGVSSSPTEPSSFSCVSRWSIVSTYSVTATRSEARLDRFSPSRSNVICASACESQQFVDQRVAIPASRPAGAADGGPLVTGSPFHAKH